MLKINLSAVLPYTNVTKDFCVPFNAVCERKFTSRFNPKKKSNADQLQMETS